MRTEDGYFIARCLSGDSSAFSFLVDKYKACVYAVAYDKLRNFHDAEDVSQEVFLKAYSKLPTLRRWDSFAFWLHRIAVNVCRNWVRTQSRRPDYEYIEAEGTSILHDSSVYSYREELLCESVREALSELPYIYQQTLILHYLGGMSTREIARFVCVSPAAVRKRLSKGRAMLREDMLSTMRIALEGQSLQASFTFRIAEAAKHIRIQPPPRSMPVISLGIATTLGILLVALNPGLRLNPPDSVEASTGSARLMKIEDTDEMPVSIMEVSKLYLDSSQQTDSVDAVSMLQDTANNTLFVRVSSASALNVGQSDTWDSVHVAHPDVIYDGNEYRMWYSGDDGSSNRTGYATSVDGVVWRKYPGNPVLDVGESGTWDAVYAHMPCVLFDGDRYRMWYTGVDSHEAPQKCSIGYATSTDGISWEKHPGNPVIEAGKPGEWDDIRVISPSVLLDGNIYKMWYVGYHGKSAISRIGYATSVDGVVWRKYPGNPVLDVGSSGAWDSGYFFEPCVRFDGSQYEMWYGGEDDSHSKRYRIGYATSRDGIVWQKHPGNPVLDVSSDGWDSQRVSGPSVLFDGEHYRMWYHGFDGFNWRIGCGVSVDQALAGKLFTKP